MAEDNNNDNPSDGNGKDVLYGWLVGRAAADLGLAQALAASEAQRAEQFRRLESTLMGELRALQNGAGVTSASSSASGDHGLEENVAQRQSFFEAQQASLRHLEERLTARISALETNRPEPPDNDFTGSDAADLATNSDLSALENSLQGKLNGLQQEIREKAALLRLRDSELGDLRGNLVSMSERLEKLASSQTPEAAAQEREAERLRWHREADERWTARLRELGDEIRGKLQTMTGAKVDQEQFRSEIAALKAALTEQPQAQPSDALRGVEETLQRQIEGVHNQLAQNHLRAHDAEEQVKALRAEIESLAQRHMQAEELVKQLQLQVSQDSAQIRGGLKADLAAIEAQLNERRARDAALQSMEGALTARFEELQNHLAQRMTALERRDGEIQELKKLVQTLTQRLGQSGAAPQLDGGLRVLEPTASAPFSDAGPVLQPAELGRPTMAPLDLHERMSADIERKRAELREKSGRWKARP